MKKRIRNGQYSFPNPEWNDVSDEGRNDIVSHTCLVLLSNCLA